MIANIIGIALAALCVMAIAVCVVIIATLIRSSRDAAAKKLAREPTQFQRETFARLREALIEAAGFASTEQQKLRLIVLANARIADVLANHTSYALGIGMARVWDVSDYGRHMSRARGLAEVLSQSVRWPASAAEADHANALADAAVALAAKQ